MRPTMIIDGENFDYAVDRTTYAVSYIPITGKNGGTMIDGTTVVDVVARKARIEFRTNGMRADRVQRLLRKLSRDYVMVTFTDPMENQDRTALMIPSIGAFPLPFFKGDVAWYGPTSVTLTER